VVVLVRSEAHRRARRLLRESVIPDCLDETVECVRVVALRDELVEGGVIGEELFHAHQSVGDIRVEIRVVGDAMNGHGSCIGRTSVICSAC
jgi:hypothetical protein